MKRKDGQLQRLSRPPASSIGNRKQSKPSPTASTAPTLPSRPPITEFDSLTRRYLAKSSKLAKSQGTRKVSQSTTNIRRAWSQFVRGTLPSSKPKGGFQPGSLCVRGSSREPFKPLHSAVSACVSDITCRVEAIPMVEILTTNGLRVCHP